MRYENEELNKLIGAEFKLLDKGFIRIVDYMGGDNAIVQAARVSYGEGTKQVNEDRGLIRYLLRHKHTTPFEMCEIKFHVKCPIFVARQWMRHRAGSFNEYSGRYSLMPEIMYVPEAEDIHPQSNINKQGRSAEDYEIEKAEHIINDIRHIMMQCFESYHELIDEYDLSRELARIVLPLSTYTEFYWKVNLHNLMHFVRLRADNHAQYEIRQYALCILDILRDWVPFTYEAFHDYVLNSKTFSEAEFNFFKEMVNPTGDLDASALSKREMQELQEKIKGFFEE